MVAADVGPLRVIDNTATSLGGCIADEESSLAWLFAVDSVSQPDHEALLPGVGVLVSGSTTYEWVLREEDLVAHPEKWPAYDGARPYDVFTSRDLPVPAGADVRFVRGSVAEALPAIRAAAGQGDVWVVGGGDRGGSSSTPVRSTRCSSASRRPRSRAGPRCCRAGSGPTGSGCGRPSGSTSSRT